MRLYDETAWIERTSRRLLALAVQDGSQTLNVVYRAIPTTFAVESHGLQVRIRF